MIEPTKVIRGINQSCKNYFSESMFCLNPDTDNKFIISGNYLSKAINYHKNDREEINVLKWFEDFWLYIEIEFKNSETEILNTFISLSVFQGDNNDNVKNQLFRAEWDHFDKNDNHPQPHWQIYSDLSFTRKVDDFSELIDEGESFSEMIREEKSKVVNIERFHFAMNGDWSTNGNHIHSISDNNTIINWFQGLLRHIKFQLEFLK